jgi:hypothetical protein
MERRSDESYISFVDRASQSLADGIITYEEWSESVLDEVLYSEENLRRCYQFFSKFLDKLDKEEIKELNGDKRVLEIRKAQDDLIKERKRLQTVNSEYSANVRGQARFEMFNERIEEAIEALTPITFNKNKINYITQDSVGVLCIADAHNGVEINMKSLFGESVNVYNPDILKARLNMLLNQVVADKERFADYGKLVVFDLGDAIQNMLRMSDLTKLKTGVIESTLDYAEMISCWLNKLNEELKVPIEYVCLGGNHMELRLLEEKKNFEEENLGRVVREFVALRLKDNPNITIDPYEEYGFKTIQGINILAIHGEDSKADLQEISFWEEYHNISIDILLMGHVHHGEQNTVGYGLTGNKEVIKIPSLVGVDTFSKKCRKMARAGAKFMLFEDGSKTWEKNYVLN